jgi:hypothetical protein
VKVQVIVALRGEEERACVGFCWCIRVVDQPVWVGDVALVRSQGFDAGKEAGGRPRARASALARKREQGWWWAWRAFAQAGRSPAWC